MDTLLDHLPPPPAAAAILRDPFHGLAITGSPLFFALLRCSYLPYGADAGVARERVRIVLRIADAMLRAGLADDVLRDVAAATAAPPDARSAWPLLDARAFRDACTGALRARVCHGPLTAAQWAEVPPGDYLAAALPAVVAREAWHEAAQVARRLTAARRERFRAALLACKRVGVPPGLAEQIALPVLSA